MSPRVNSDFEHPELNQCASTEKDLFGQLNLYSLEFTVIGAQPVPL